MRLTEHVLSATAAAVISLMTVGVAVAQVVPSPVPDPKKTIPEKTVPDNSLPRQPNPSPAPQDTPSVNAEPKNGVLTPPNSEMDTGIHAPAPVPEPNTTPVISPPGSPGGDPTVKPK